MKKERELEEGLYFVHGSYISGHNEKDIMDLRRDQVILLKDSMDFTYEIDAYDINLREMRIETEIPQGEFVYYNGESLYVEENNLTSIMYTELNRRLISLIENENYENRPEEIQNNISDVYSYHINVGHGNCSIIVFCENKKYNIWMVDCSVFDFTNKQNYSMNLDICMKNINNQFNTSKISKLLITHLHYDHINGIEYLIKNGWIDKNTEVWMNIQYPWKQPTYNRILLQLNALGVKFINPVVANSTQNINILYPDVSFSIKNIAPKKNINNASVLYQICLDGIKMLFTGDIETEGWESVNNCYPYLNKSTYYCISHHGSITGHYRKRCNYNHSINTLAQCAHGTKLHILMGRNGAYKGVFSKNVISDFGNIVKTEDSNHYIEIQWLSGKYKCY